MSEIIRPERVKSDLELHVECLSHENPAVRQIALKELAQIRDSKAFPFVRQHLAEISRLLKDPHPLTRSRAVDVLVLFGNYSVLEDLRKVASNADEQEDIRERAKLAISKIDEAEKYRFDWLFKGP